MEPTSLGDVNDIRPDNLVRTNEFELAKKHDHDWVMSRSNQFVTVRCPACDCSMTHLPLRKDGFLFARCCDCVTLYMPTRLPEKLLGEFYSQSKVMEYFGRVIFPGSYQNRVEKIYKPRLARLLDLVLAFEGNTEHFVEVGAGSGVFLELLKEKSVFKKITAIEPSNSLAEECISRGLHTIAEPVENVSGLNADVVASFEVIEHLFSPYDYLKSMSEIMNVGSLCFLTTPNSLSFEVLELGEFSTTVGMNHINLLTPTAIQKLSDRTGFEVVQISTPGLLDIDLVKNGYEEPDKGSRSNFIQYLVGEVPSIVKQNFQNFLVENALSSHMWVVLRKKGDSL